MTLTGDVSGAAILGGTFLGLLAAAEAWARLGRPDPEWTRKLVHVGGGAVCLCFPFFISSPWVVLVMSVLLAGVFALGGKTGTLQSVHGVKRRSRGAEYYPLAVTLVFAMSLDKPWLYVASILVLAVADAAAALVGGSYGKIRYEVDDSIKSLEGSLAFGVIAFLAIHIPLLLMTGLSRETCLLAALLVALLVTGFEAVSISGVDNLFVPIGVCAILMRITTKPVPEIAFQLSSLLILCLIIVLSARRTRAFNTGATITFILFAYGAWSLGSPHWAIPVLLAFVLYMLIRRPHAQERQLQQIKVRVLFRALVIPLVLLVLANTTHSAARLYAPFVAVWATVTAFAAGRHWVFFSALGGRMRCGLYAGVAALVTVVLGTWAIVRTAHGGLILAIALLVVGATLVRLSLLKEEDVSEQARLWSAPDLALTVGVAVVIYLLQGLPGIGEWAPAAFSFPDGFS